MTGTMTNFMIAMILLTGVFMGLFTFLTVGAQQYNVAVNGSFNESYSKMQDLINETMDFQQDINTAQIDDANLFETVSRGAIKSVKGLYSSINVFNSVVSAAVQDTIGIPSWAWSVFVAIVTLVVLGGLFFAFMGREP